MPDTWAAVVVEMDIDQDAHTAVAFCRRTAFDSRQRAIEYARQSTADDAIVYQGDRIIYPEEASV